MQSGYHFAGRHHDYLLCRILHGVHAAGDPLFVIDDWGSLAIRPEERGSRMLGRTVALEEWFLGSRVVVVAWGG